MPRMPWLASLIAATTLVVAPSIASAAPPACTKTFTGNGTWSTAASWTGGTVPVSGDVVCWGAGNTLTVDTNEPQVIFGSGSGTLAFSGNGSVTAIASATTQGPIAAIVMSTGTLGVSGGVTLSVGDLTMTGTASTRGSINGSTGTTLDVSGTVSISGGYLYSVAITQSVPNAGAGDGAIHIPTGGTGVSGAGGSPFLYSSSITTTRPVTIGNPTLDLYFSLISTTGTTTLASGYDNTGSGSYNSLLSTGGLVTTGASTTLLGTSLQLTGSSSSVAGTVHVGGLGSTAGGALALPSGAAIIVDSTGLNSQIWAGSLSGVAPGNAGAVTLLQGTTTFTGSLANVDLTLANNGTSVPTVTVTPSTATAFHPHALNVNAGSLYVTGSDTISADALTMQGANTSSRGSISGGGTSGGSVSTLNVGGPISILGGQLSSILVNQTASGGALTFPGGPSAGTGSGAPNVSSAVINNGDGPITITNPALYLYFATLTTTGTTTLANGYDNTASATYYSFLSTGGLVTTGASTTLSAISLQLTGSSSSIAGTVHLGGLGSSANGTLALASSAAIIVDSSGMGTPTWAGALTGAAPGNAGSVTLKQGSLLFTGTVSDVDLTLTNNGGSVPSVTATPSTTTAFHPHALNVNAGTLYVTSSDTITADTFTMQGSNTSSRGSISGAGTSGSSSSTLNVGGPISILGGQLSSILVNQTNSSALTFGGGINAGTGTGAPALSSAVINNGDGPVTITNPALYLYFSTITTTGTTTLASSYDNTASTTLYSFLSTGGLVTSGATTTLNGISLQLTGSTSNVAGAVHVGGLGSSANGTLALPSTAAITVDSTGMGAPLWAGSLTGAAPANAGSVTLKQGSTTFTGTVSDVDLTLANISGTVPGVTVTPSTSTAFHPHALNVNAGSFTVTSGDTITADSLTMQGANTTSRGSINGGGTSGGSTTSLNVGGPISILGGALNNIVVNQTASGALTFGGGSSAGTGNGAPNLSGAVINNGDGPVTITNPALYLYSSTITTTGTTSFAPTYDGSASNSYYSHLSAAGFQSVGGSDLAGVTLPPTVDFTITGGTTTLRTGTVASGDWFIKPGATLVAIGGIGGRVTNQGGTVQLGTRGSQTPVTVTFTNGYAQTSGTLAVDVPSPIGIDKLVQSGGQPASLTGGTIDVTFSTSYRPDNAFDRIPVDGTGAPNGIATASGITVTSPQITGRRQLVVDNKGLGTTATKSLHLTFPSATPLAPTLTGVPGDTQASITIGAPADDGGSPILHYTVSCVPDCGPAAPGATGVVSSFTVAATAAGHAIVLHGLGNDQGYTFQVVAQNANGTTDPSSPVSLTPSHLPVGSLILAPTSLVATSSSASFTATCGTDVYAPIASCSVVAKSGATVIAGPATKVLSDFTIPVIVKVTAKGIKAAAVAGGVVATVTATITLADHRVLKAVAQIVITKKKAKKIVISSSILFASGSATIGAGGKKFLAQKAKLWLKGAKSVTCTGYTDSDGDAAANYTLGLNRAKAVCAELKKTMGTKVKYLVGSGGETHPVASNNTDAGKAANRRVELSVS